MGSHGLDSPGKLCISVIEARNVLADTVIEPSFYVRLRLGLGEVKTDIVHNDIAPKFLKDVRMGVSSPQNDILLVELLQCGPTGDLVVGRDQLPVASVINQGTVVHWFQLTSLDEEVTGELCTVLRYLQAGITRPTTPSYAIAAREAKQRALEGSQSGAAGMEPAGAGAAQRPSKALFSDLNQQPQQEVPGVVQGTQQKQLPEAALEAEVGVAAEAATPSTPAAAAAGGSLAGSLAPSTPAKVDATPFTRPGEEVLSPVTSAALPAEPSGATTEASSAPPASAQGTAVSVSQPAVAAAPLAVAQQAIALTQETSKSHDSSSTSVAGTSGRAGGRLDLSSLKLDLSTLPVPLAALSSALLGGLLMLLRARSSSRPRFMEDSEGELVCVVGDCFRPHLYEKYKRQYGGSGRPRTPPGYTPLDS